MVHRTWKRLVFNAGKNDFGKPCQPFRIDKHTTHPSMPRTKSAESAAKLGSNAFLGLEVEEIVEDEEIEVAPAPVPTPKSKTVLPPRPQSRKDWTRFQLEADEPTPVAPPTSYLSAALRAPGQARRFQTPAPAPAQPPARSMSDFPPLGKPVGSTISGSWLQGCAPIRSPITQPAPPQTKPQVLESKAPAPVAPSSVYYSDPELRADTTTSWW